MTWSIVFSVVCVYSLFWGLSWRANRLFSVSYLRNAAMVYSLWSNFRSGTGCHAICGTSFLPLPASVSSAFEEHSLALHSGINFPPQSSIPHYLVVQLHPFVASKLAFILEDFRTGNSCDGVHCER